MSVRCREGPAAHSVWFPHFLPHGGKHLQEGLQLFFFSFFLFIKPITFPFFWWYTAWSGMFSFLSSPFFAFWMCRSVWSDRNTFFFFFLLTYRNKNPYTGIIVIYCCCCFSCLLFLLCIDNFTDCHFLFYVCFFFLVSFSWIWRQVGVSVNLLLGFKSTCTQTNKHTNQPVKKRSSTFLKRSFSKTVEFLLHFPSCDIYILWLWGVERLPKAWCIMTGPGSQLLLLHVLSCLFPPSLSLRLISLTVRLITRASGIISESPS